jgi:hypothetical protein
MLSEHLLLWKYFYEWAISSFIHFRKYVLSLSDEYAFHWRVTQKCKNVRRIQCVFKHFSLSRARKVVSIEWIPSTMLCLRFIEPWKGAYFYREEILTKSYENKYFIFFRLRMENCLRLRESIELPLWIGW